MRAPTVKPRPLVAFDQAAISSRPGAGRGEYPSRLSIRARSGFAGGPARLSHAASRTPRRRGCDHRTTPRVEREREVVRVVRRSSGGRFRHRRHGGGAARERRDRGLLAFASCSPYPREPGRSRRSPRREASRDRRGASHAPWSSSRAIGCVNSSSRARGPRPEARGLLYVVELRRASCAGSSRARPRWLPPWPRSWWPCSRRDPRRPRR